MESYMRDSRLHNGQCLQLKFPKQIKCSNGHFLHQPSIKAQSTALNHISMKVFLKGAKLISLRFVILADLT